MDGYLYDSMFEKVSLELYGADATFILLKKGFFHTHWWMSSVHRAPL